MKTKNTPHGLRTVEQTLLSAMPCYIELKTCPR